jgi:hypothetical protein
MAAVSCLPGEELCWSVGGCAASTRHVRLQHRRHVSGACKSTTGQAHIGAVHRSISAYLVQAWDVRNSCKHNGAVLPLSAAPVGRGADGVDAMA